MSNFIRFISFGPVSGFEVDGGALAFKEVFSFPFVEARVRSYEAIRTGISARIQ